MAVAIFVQADLPASYETLMSVILVKLAIYFGQRFGERNSEMQAERRLERSRNATTAAVPLTEANATAFSIIRPRRARVTGLCNARWSRTLNPRPLLFRIGGLLLSRSPSPRLATFALLR